VRRVASLGMEVALSEREVEPLVTRALRRRLLHEVSSPFVLCYNLVSGFIAPLPPRHAWIALRLGDQHENSPSATVGILHESEEEERVDGGRSSTGSSTNTSSGIDSIAGSALRCLGVQHSSVPSSEMRLVGSPLRGEEGEGTVVLVRGCKTWIRVQPNAEALARPTVRAMNAHTPGVNLRVCSMQCKYPQCRVGRGWCTGQAGSGRCSCYRGPT